MEVIKTAVEENSSENCSYDCGDCYDCSDCFDRD